MDALQVVVDSDTGLAEVFGLDFCPSQNARAGDLDPCLWAVNLKRIFIKWSFFRWKGDILGLSRSLFANPSAMALALGKWLELARSVIHEKS